MDGLVRLTGANPAEDQLARILERYVNEQLLIDPKFLWREGL